MLLSLLPLACLALALAPPAAPPDAQAKAKVEPVAEATVPDPTLAPQDVVRAVLAALRHNDEPRKDAGIATTFGFASAENRKVTGPLDHFTEIVKHPSYRPMLGHKSANQGPVRLVGNQAFQHVKLIGADDKVVEFDFILSKDAASKCWLTDGVLRTPPPPPRPPRRDEI